MIHFEKDKKTGKYPDYEIESAMRSLQRAEEVRKTPDLLAEVKKFAKKQIDAIKSIAQIKEKVAKMSQEEKEEDY